MTLKKPVISADEAARLVKDGDTVGMQGSGGGVSEPTALIAALRRRYDAEQCPKNLTLMHATGLGDKQGGCGTDLLAVQGLVKRDIAGHLAMAPVMGKMIQDNQIECYNLPQGVISQLFTAIGARKPGVITKTGLGTFVDPRIEGGKMNKITQEDLVEVLNLKGEQWLFYPSQPVHVAFIRGTRADEQGNISSDQEGSILEGIGIAQAAKASGGVVIAQVKYTVKDGEILPHNVTIPSTMVDYIVVDPAQKQTCLFEYDPSISGEKPVKLAEMPPEPLSIKKVIGLRAARELHEGYVVNLGVGIPDQVAAVASESGMVDRLTFTLEHGIIGGKPAAGVIFGVSHNPRAIISEMEQFNFYDGGGLDIAFLGMAETDRMGNVNVSKVGNLLSGCGGFINITQNAKRVVFCGTLTAKGLKCKVGDGKLTIEQEGAVPKFVENVSQITFSGAYAAQVGQEVLFVTERAVFTLGEKGLTLVEIAPGVDLQKDVLDQMRFAPAVSPDLKLMDTSLFTE